MVCFLGVHCSSGASRTGIAVELGSIEALSLLGGGCKRGRLAAARSAALPRHGSLAYFLEWVPVVLLVVMVAALGGPVLVAAGRRGLALLGRVPCACTGCLGRFL